MHGRRFAIQLQLICQVRLCCRYFQYFFTIIIIIFIKLAFVALELNKVKYSDGCPLFKWGLPVAQLCITNAFYGVRPRGPLCARKHQVFGSRALLPSLISKNLTNWDVLVSALIQRATFLLNRFQTLLYEDLLLKHLGLFETGYVWSAGH